MNDLNKKELSATKLKKSLNILVNPTVRDIGLLIGEVEVRPKETCKINLGCLELNSQFILYASLTSKNLVDAQIIVTTSKDEITSALLFITNYDSKIINTEIRQTTNVD